MCRADVKVSSGKPAQIGKPTAHLNMCQASMLMDALEQQAMVCSLVCQAKVHQVAFQKCATVTQALCLC